MNKKKLPMFNTKVQHFKDLISFCNNVFFLITAHYVAIFLQQVFIIFIFVWATGEVFGFKRSFSKVFM